MSIAFTPKRSGTLKADFINCAVIAVIVTTVVVLIVIFPKIARGRRARTIHK